MQHKYKFKFGDLVLNRYAGERNPHRIGMFIKYVKNGYECITQDGERYVLGSNKNGWIFQDNGEDELILIGSGGIYFYVWGLPA